MRDEIEKSGDEDKVLLTDWKRCCYLYDDTLPLENVIQAAAHVWCDD